MCGKYLLKGVCLPAQIYFMFLLLSEFKMHTLNHVNCNVFR